MGLLIDSPTLAARLTDWFDTAMPMEAYEVRLAADGRQLEWIERTRSGEKRFDTEPGTGPLQRASVGFLSVLPIEWML